MGPQLENSEFNFPSQFDNSLPSRIPFHEITENLSISNNTINIKKPNELYKDDDINLTSVTDKLHSNYCDLRFKSNSIKNSMEKMEQRNQSLNRINDFDKQRSNELKKISRISQITVSEEGIIRIGGMQIYVEDLLFSPKIIDGIYVSASQDNIPKLLNGVLIVIADIKINFLDLYFLSNKTVKITKILHLYNTYRKLKIIEEFNDSQYTSKIFLNGKFWTFNKKIISVYLLKHQNGFMCMLKIRKSKYSDLYLDIHRSGNKLHYFKIIIATFIIFLATFSFLFLYYLKNLIILQRISKSERIYLGKYNGKDSIVYRINKETLSIIRELTADVKNGSLVNVYFEGNHFFQPICITERTLQFNASDWYKLYLQNSKTYKEELLRFLKQLAITIEAIHAKGLVHSRLCPENIRIIRNRNINHIGLQMIFSNYGWRSKNQIRSKASKPYSPTAADDVFSLGCIIHYFLTGFNPYGPGLKNPKALDETNKIVGSTLTDTALIDDDVNVKDCNEREEVENVLFNVTNSQYNEKKALSNQERNKIFNFVYKKIKIAYSTAKMYCLSGISKTNEFFFKSKNILDIDMKKKYFQRVFDHNDSEMVEYNIMFNEYQIVLKNQIEYDLIYHCLKYTTFLVSEHPLFWNYHRKTEFVCDCSDFVQTNPGVKGKLEKNKNKIFIGTWNKYIDQSIAINLTCRRLYDFTSLCDLMRFIRNCQRHSMELLNRNFFDKYSEKNAEYFMITFPDLFIYLYRSTAFRTETDFKKYYL